MRKRYLAVLMAVTMGLSISACGRTESGKISEEDVTVSVESSEDSKEQEPSEEENTGENTEDVSVEDKSQSDSTIFPNLEISHIYYDAGEDAPYMYGSYKMAKVIGEDYPELKTSVEKWFADFEDNYKSKAQQYIKDAKIDAEIRGDDFYTYSLEEDVTATRVDDRVVSIAIDENSYSGGVHGSDYLYGITFDTKTGQEISFESLGDIREDVKAYVTKYIEEKRTEGYMYELFDDAIEGKLDNPDWYLSEQGLEFVFNIYEIASYAEGRTVVTIPYEEMKNFNPDYCPKVDSMLAGSDLNSPVDMDVDKD